MKKIDSMNLKLEFEEEDDRRWLAEINEAPGVIVHGQRHEQGAARVQALGLRAIDDRREHGEAASDMLRFFFIAA